MKRGQTWWLRIVLFGSIIHLIRDILQELGIHTFLSDVWVKPIEERPPGLLWSPYNTLVIEIVLICLSVYLLRKNTIKHWGKFIGLILVTTLIAFMYYWNY